MYKLFSQRQLEAEGNIPDVYVYDSFPKVFRNQLIHIITSIMNSDSLQYYSERFYQEICEAFCREKGLKALYYRGYRNTDDALEQYIDECSDEDFLDLLDFLFSSCFVILRDKNMISKETFTNYVNELNYRFNQHFLGYEFVDDKLLIKTNEHIHKEIIKPAIALLHNSEFAGAEEEYFIAFDCFKKGNNKDAIINANKAFESTMKVICNGMEYGYNPTKNTAKELIKILEDNGFYPSFLNSFITNIRVTLEGGAPTIRNKIAGHGQGGEIVNIPREYVEYVLGLVATSIVFLTRLYNEKKAKQC